MDNISMLIEYDNINDILDTINEDNPNLVGHCINNIDFGIKHHVKLLPIFELKNRKTGSLMVFCLPEKDYKKSLTFLRNWAIQLEEFEFAAKTRDLIKTFKK